MSNGAVVRRLAAIVAADVVAYSRLMETDEVGTLTALKTHRRDLIDPAIAAHHGRLVNTAGDGLLLEFASVVDAIGCAVAIQRGMLPRNAAVPEARRIVLRVGVNIGDVIIDGGDIFGDGVNVAARLQALCEPGGICISRAANEQIRDKLSLSFADLGEHAVKNIARAVGVYGLTAQDIAALPEAPVRETPVESDTFATAQRWRYRTVAAGCAALAALGVGAALWWSGAWPGRTPADAPSPLSAQLAAALASSLPGMPAGAREREAKGFAEGKEHRAMAVARQAQRTFWTGAWPRLDLAEEKVLEKCQQHYDEPCALVASNDLIARPGGDGSFPLRDAPRVRYAGPFNPERIPALRDDVVRRGDVAGYATSPAPKASAFHAAGILHVVVGAPSQRAAEEQALRACNDDPARRAAGGPCYLYSADNRVVLPLRTTGALTPAAPPPAPAAVVSPPPQPSAPAAPPSAPALRDVLMTALAKMAPAYSNRDEQVRQYLGSNAHKALAVHTPSGSWRNQNWNTAQIAEERVLEACQARFGAPCVLLAVNDAVRADAAEPNWPRRSMPRVVYDGLFDPERIPAAAQSLRQRADVAGYRGAPSPKAAAFHPWGRLFVITGVPTQRAAEAQALAACNRDPDRDNRDGACLLYAIDNTVVLPKRLSAPTTAE